MRSLPEGGSALDLPIAVGAYIYTCIFVSVFTFDFSNYCACCCVRLSCANWCPYVTYMKLVSCSIFSLLVYFLCEWSYLEVQCTGYSSIFGINVQWICSEEPIWYKHLPSCKFTLNIWNVMFEHFDIFTYTVFHSCWSRYKKRTISVLQSSNTYLNEKSQ